MGIIFLFLYRLALASYALVIRLAALLGKEKASLWLKGRKTQKKSFPTIQFEQPLIWVHCASLGEFEQGRPVIESLRDYYPEAKILLSFFSPSGYEIRKNYKGANYVCYLPLDSPFNARKFIQQIQPKLAIFVKYEFWYYYMRALQKNKIPLVFISAIFRKEQFYFKWYGAWFRKIFKGVHHFFVQDILSTKILEKFNISQYSLSGDTRVDRVLKIAGQAKEYPLVEAFSEASERVLVAGSTWREDEDILVQFINQKPANTRFIIAPHNIESRFIKRLLSTLKVPTVCYSEATKESLETASVLIIDNIGMLAYLYRYGNIAYIGGGFGSGIHNTLEAAVYGVPLIFGPNYKKFKEAVELIKDGGAFSIVNFQDLEATLLSLEKPKKYKRAAESSLQYLEKNKGASREILNYIKQLASQS